MPGENVRRQFFRKSGRRSLIRVYLCPSVAEYHQSFNAPSNRSRNGCCASFNFRFASETAKKPTRSTSGTCTHFPDLGGHSIENRLLFSGRDSSQSPANAQA